ncbi:amino acid ABC transporter substrate-binding protein [Calothrix rhizosoleniae]|uniref:amino acid ABC transporter substrate-binding protein n=1 Tax=Calothrix rhizosoleniae TaxID=888997 RepID=UPI000B4A4C58|nr:amino acid ABC transporter substrate-binding protein [Calothrix rhizosoleniae]
MFKSVFLSAIAFLAIGLTACGGDANTSGKNSSLLDQVKSRGRLTCGVNGEVPGFSFVGTDGKYNGLDVDICRGMAAALFDNPEAVDYRNLNAKERFTAVQTGEVDLLSRNTTLTISRDTSVGMAFAPIVFYDGQGMMVSKNSNIKSLKDLQGKTICTQTGTTSEQNLADKMRELGITYKPVVFEDANTSFATYQSGRCDAITADKSGLISRRSILPKPDNHMILDEVLSQEPLAPAVADGDEKWADALKWVVYALIKAEELGINSQNVAKLANSNNPEIKRFLGREGNLGEGMGLSPDFAVRIIKHVGNYGEIYDRNLGPKTKLNLPRSYNQPWTKGGLLYSPPFR